jgi:hypothetical protein
VIDPTLPLRLVPAGLAVRLDNFDAAAGRAELEACAARFGWPLPAGVHETADGRYVKACLTETPCKGLMPFRLLGHVTVWCAIVDGNGLEQRERRS